MYHFLKCQHHVNSWNSVEASCKKPGPATSISLLITCPFGTFVNCFSIFRSLEDIISYEIIHMCIIIFWVLTMCRAQDYCFLKNQERWAIKSVSEAHLRTVHRSLWSSASAQVRPEPCRHPAGFDLSESHVGNPSAFRKGPSALEMLQKAWRTLRLVRS